MNNLLYTLHYPFGSVIGHVLLLEMPDYRIEAYTEDGGRTWDITHEEKKHEKGK